jgi:hypothetical protein
VETGDKRQEQQRGNLRRSNNGSGKSNLGSQAGQHGDARDARLPARTPPSAHSTQWPVASQPAKNATTNNSRGLEGLASRPPRVIGSGAGRGLSFASPSVFFSHYHSLGFHFSYLFLSLLLWALSSVLPCRSNSSTPANAQRGQVVSWPSTHSRPVGLGATLCRTRKGS